MPIKKIARRVFRKGKQAFKKRYTNKNGLVNVVKDVMTLKRLMNVEKKRIHIYNASVLLGQCSVNAFGYHSQDITPIPVEGVGYQQRTGASIKVLNAYIKFQFWQQASNVHVTKFRIEFWKVKGGTTVAAGLATDLYLANPNISGSTIIDYNSLRNPDFFGEAKKIFSKNYTNRPNFSTEVAITDVVISLKLDHHIRYDKDTNNVTDGQLVMFIFCDSGNSGAVSTLTGVPVTTALSGLIYNNDFCFYYVDN